MSRIKDNQKDYIDKQVEERLRRAGEEKNISISFEHELSNSSYSPDGIRDKNDRLRFYEQLRIKMKNITGKTWRDFGKESKRIGYETLPFKQFTKNMQASLRHTNIVSPDSKLDVIRVANDYSVIGKYLAGVYYVIAYDISFSAYKH